LVLSRACTNLAADGTCKYTLVATDFDDVGQYLGELEGTGTGVIESLKKFGVIVIESGSATVGYCTLNEVKDELGITVEDNDFTLMGMILQVKGIIDNWCNRDFLAATATRYFDGGNPLFIDDLVSVTTLKLDEDGDATFESTLADTDYLLYPLNKYPKTTIKLSEASNYGGFANGVRKGVEIAGSWGYASTIPRPIRRLAIMMTIRLFETGGTAFKSEKLGDYSYTINDSDDGLTQTEKAIAEPYRKWNI